MLTDEGRVKGCLGSIGQLYTALALVVFNTFLAFACLNLALLPSLPPSTPSLDFPAYNEGTLRYGLDRLRLAYPHYDDPQIIRLLIETWNRPFQCDQDTGFIESPYRGQFVNVADQHYRMIADQEPLQASDSTNAMTVFVFGGSTTFGYGEADSQTIPSHLQSLLRQAQGGTAAVNVYNFGQGSFTSVQERLLLNKLLRQGFVPNLAIFIDGLNDFARWQEDPLTYAACHAANPLSSLLACPVEGFCLPITRWLSSRLPVVVRDSQPADNMPPEDDPEVNRRIVRRWLDQAQGIRDLAQNYGFNTLFVRQPVPSYRYNLNFHPFKTEFFWLYTRTAHGYPLWEQMVGQPDFHYLDLASMLTLREDVVFVDGVHYSGAFMHDMAARIAQTIQQEGLLSDAPRDPLAATPFRFVADGQTWELKRWEVTTPAERYRPCQAIDVESLWYQDEPKELAKAVDYYLAFVLQRDGEQLLKAETLLAHASNYTTRGPFTSHLARLELPCDAAEGSYDLIMTLTAYEPASGESHMVNAFNEVGGIGPYLYLKTFLIVSTRANS